MAKSHTEKHPLVTIIVPIYNTAKYLPACLDSIINQSYRQLEIILIDDGSTDQSGQIADNYAAKDPRITVIHQSNQGQSAARNAGLKKATGVFLSFVDADDQIEPLFIEELIAPLLSSTAAMSVCGMHYKRLKSHSVDDVYIKPLRPRHQSETIKAYILYLLTIDGRMYSSVNKLYRTAITKKITFDQNLNFAEDTKFVLDYFNKTSADPVFIQKPLYIYNFGTETSTIRSTATKWQNWQKQFETLKSWLGKPQSTREKFLLLAIYLRWHISYIRSKRRAKK